MKKLLKKLLLALLPVLSMAALGDDLKTPGGYPVQYCEKIATSKQMQEILHQQQKDGRDIPAEVEVAKQARDKVHAEYKKSDHSKKARAKASDEAYKHQQMLTLLRNVQKCAEGNLKQTKWVGRLPSREEQIKEIEKNGHGWICEHPTFWDRLSGYTECKQYACKKETDPETGEIKNVFVSHPFDDSKRDSGGERGGYSYYYRNNWTYNPTENACYYARRGPFRVEHQYAVQDKVGRKLFKLDNEHKRAIAAAASSFGE